MMLVASMVLAHAQYSNEKTKFRRICFIVLTFDMVYITRLYDFLSVIPSSVREFATTYTYASKFSLLNYLLGLLFATFAF